MALKPEVIADLLRHGLAAAPGEAPAGLRERLNDLYVDDVRRLRERRRAGEIPLRHYASQAEALKRRYALLGLPLDLWSE